jgi:hypothetical protein
MISTRSFGAGAALGSVFAMGLYHLFACPVEIKTGIARFQTICNAS